MKEQTDSWRYNWKWRSQQSAAHYWWWPTPNGVPRNRPSMFCWWPRCCCPQHFAWTPPAVGNRVIYIYIDDEGWVQLCSRRIGEEEEEKATKMDLSFLRAHMTGAWNWSCEASACILLLFLKERKRKENLCRESFYSLLFRFSLLAERNGKIPLKLDRE